MFSATLGNPKDDRGTDLIMTPISSHSDEDQLRNKVPLIYKFE